MGVLFGTNQIGQVVAMDSPSGATMPSFSFQDTGDDRAVFGNPPWYARGFWAYATVGVGPALYAGGAAVSDGLGAAGYHIDRFVRQTGQDVYGSGDTDMTPQRLGLYGDPHLGRETFSDLLGGGRWGYILGVQGGFQESIKSDNGTTISGSSPPLGDLSLEGVAFAKQCGGGDAMRHGLEGILYHYYYNRASAGTGRGAPKMSISIGQTTFRDSFLSGLVMRVIDANFNIWGWTLSYKTSSKYRPKKL